MTKENHENLSASEPHYILVPANTHQKRTQYLVMIKL